jgi:hypothetical protein
MDRCLRGFSDTSLREAQVSMAFALAFLVYSSRVYSQSALLVHFCHTESGGTRARCVGLATTRSCAARPLNTRVTRKGFCAACGHYALRARTQSARARAAARCLEARAIARFPGVTAESLRHWAWIDRVITQTD